MACRYTSGKTSGEVQVAHRIVSPSTCSAMWRTTSPKVLVFSSQYSGALLWVFTPASRAMASILSESDETTMLVISLTCLSCCILFSNRLVPANGATFLFFNRVLPALTGMTAVIVFIRLGLYVYVLQSQLVPYRKVVIVIPIILLFEVVFYKSVPRCRNPAACRCLCLRCRRWERIRVVSL